MRELDKTNSIFKDKIQINQRDFYVLFAYLIFLLVFSWSFLNDDLAQDEWYNAERSQMVSLVFAMKALSHFSTWSRFAFQKIIWLLNLFALIFSLGYLFLFKSKKPFFIGSVILFFLTCRIGVIMLGGYSDKHSPFRTFPMWLSSAILGPTALGLHFAQLGGLLLLSAVVFFFVKNRTSFWFGTFTGLSVATIPLLWHVGIICESSIWAALVWSILVLFNFSLDVESETNWIRLYSILSLGTLMRETVFWGFVPLFFAHIYFERHRLHDWKKILKMISPAFVCVPYLLQLTLGGTPATQGSKGYRFGEGLSFLYIFQNIQKDLGVVATLLLLFSFVPLRKTKIPHVLLLLIFFFGALAMFYSLNPGLWGVGRYKAEYAVPFSVMGLVGLSIFCYSLPRFVSKAYIVMLIGFIILNTIHFTHLTQDNAPVDARYHLRWDKTKILSTFVYPYEISLREMKDSGFASKHFIAGAISKYVN